MADTPVLWTRCSNRTGTLPCVVCGAGATRRTHRHAPVLFDAAVERMVEAARASSHRDGPFMFVCPETMGYLLRAAARNHQCCGIRSQPCYDADEEGLTGGSHYTDLTEEEEARLRVRAVLALESIACSLNDILLQLSSPAGAVEVELLRMAERRYIADGTVERMRRYCSMNCYPQKGDLTPWLEGLLRAAVGE